MSVPGSSRVYFGGTTAYNTKRAGKLLCNDNGLHNRLLNSKSAGIADRSEVDVRESLSEETKAYI